MVLLSLRLGHDPNNMTKPVHLTLKMELEQYGPDP